MYEMDSLSVSLPGGLCETMLPDGLGEAGKIWPNVGP